MPKNVILVTSAGTGIGRLTAQSLAEAGHIVYAPMRDIERRNKPRAEEMRALANAKDWQVEYGPAGHASAGKWVLQRTVRRSGRTRQVASRAGASCYPVDTPGSALKPPSDYAPQIPPDASTDTRDVQRWQRRASPPVRASGSSPLRPGSAATVLRYARRSARSKR